MQRRRLSSFAFGVIGAIEAMNRQKQTAEESNQPTEEEQKKARAQAQAQGQGRLRRYRRALRPGVVLPHGPGGAQGGRRHVRGDGRAGGKGKGQLGGGGPIPIGAPGCRAGGWPGT